MILRYLALNTLSDKQIKFQNHLTVKRISSQIQKSCSEALRAVRKLMEL